MGDSGIVVVSVEGTDAVRHVLAALEAEPGARVLEVHVHDDATAEQLEHFSRAAEDRGMEFRLRRSR